MGRRPSVLGFPAGASPGRAAHAPLTRKILFEGIYAVNADGSGKTFLRAGATPAWSPDGTKIVFTVGRHDHPAIYLMDADGKHLHEIVAGKGALDPTW